MTTELVKNRKDARKLFEEDQPIIVGCKTTDSDFNASIQDISGSGIFIKTTTPLSIGQEIAMTFKFAPGQRWNLKCFLINKALILIERYRSIRIRAFQVRGVPQDS
jgi:hypothetical protein